MILYNENTINEWFFSTDNIIKVYRNNAICYYKVTTSGGTSGQTPCFAVVEDISQYTDTEFEDVFNKADGKWYKLNNLNQYEEYGVYGSGRTITTYEGKLTIDTESTPQPSRLPAGYTEVEYIRQNSNYNAYINTGVILFDNVSNTYTVTTKLSSEFHSNLGCATIINCEELQHPWTGIGYRYKCSSTVDQLEFFGTTSNYSSSVVDNGDGTKTITMSYLSNVSKTTDVPLEYFASWNGNYTTPYRFADATIYSATVVKNGVTVRDFVPAKRDSDSVYGLYDLINDTFYTSPNGNNFSGGSEVIPPPITTTYEYQYSGGSWVNLGEVSGGTATLPDVPFTLNYNAKDYDASTHTIPYTEGALNAIDAVITGTTANIIDHSSDGYIELTGSTSTAIRALVGTTNFSRSSSSPNITIICKAYTPGSSTEGNILSNRKESYNWMYRHKSSILTFHGTSEQGSIAVSNTEPNTCSIRIDSSRLLTYNNWTKNTTSTYSNFNYGSNSNGGALFSGYYTTSSEMWKGVFYWIYMSLNTLTDEQVQQVIAYNEGGGGQSEYPKYYDEIQNPPDNLTFSSMAEAESYECPWWGMSADIDNTDYMFCEGNEWLTKYTYIEVSGDYLCDNGNKYKKMQEYDRIPDGTTTATTTYVKGDLIESASTDCSTDYSTQYLTLVAQTDSVSFKYDTATSSNKLQYSVDGGSTWVDLGNNQSTTSVNTGNKVLFKASGLTVNTERGVGRITPSASASVEGNIMSLEYGDNFSGQTTIQNNYQFRKLFSGVTTITSAENMVLPATTVKQQCYSQMFQGCTNLVKTPKTIGSSAMTWSGSYCFSNLFSYCTSLTTVPSGLLPALNLGTQCYWYMFEGCSGLTTAPDLLATTTASQCYQGMFKNCSSLNYIKVLSNSSFTMSEWVSGVAASGTFVKNPNVTWSSCGQNAYPCGWTVVDYSG